MSIATSRIVIEVAHGCVSAESFAASLTAFMNRQGWKDKRTGYGARVVSVEPTAPRDAE